MYTHYSLLSDFVKLVWDHNSVVLKADDEHNCRHDQRCGNMPGCIAHSGIPVQCCLSETIQYFHTFGLRQDVHIHIHIHTLQNCYLYNTYSTTKRTVHSS